MCVIPSSIRNSALALLLCVGAFGQDVYRSNVNLVTVSFSVRDARGALVDDLGKDDFDVLEDAVAQKIAFFSRSSDVPLSLGIVVDASGSQDHFSKQHKRDLEVFLRDVLGPKDRAFMVCFGNHLRLVSDFTPSGADILNGLERYNKGTGGFPELGPKESRELGTAFYDSIFYSVEKLANESGRRALLIFSDGEDNSSAHDMMSTIEAAQGANVILFSIRYTENGANKLNARNKYGISVMDRIAKETGGAVFDAREVDPHTYFQKIAEELRSSYDLAYYPSNRIKDDTFRKIVVKAKQEGLKVRAKTGYFSR